MLVILAFLRRREIAPNLPLMRFFDHLSPIRGWRQEDDLMSEAGSRIAEAGRQTAGGDYMERSSASVGSGIFGCRSLVFPRIAKFRRGNSFFGTTLSPKAARRWIGFPRLYREHL